MYYFPTITRIHRFLRAIFSGVSILIIFAALPADLPAAIKDRELKIDFAFNAYAVPNKLVTGYRLYMNGLLACEQFGTGKQSFTCTIQVDEGTYHFTLSAMYNDNTESPQSSPFAFIFTNQVAGDLNGDGNANMADSIVGLQLLSGNSNKPLSSKADVDGDNRIGIAEVLHALRSATDELNPVKPDRL